LILAIDLPLLAIASILLLDLKKRNYNPLKIKRRELLPLLLRNQLPPTAMGTCEILGGYFGREILIAACIILPWVNLIFYFTQRSASPVAHLNLPRQRRRASCRLVNAIVR